MRYLLLTLPLILLLNGCQEKQQDTEAQAKHDAQLTQQVREEVLAEIEAKRVLKEKATLKKKQEEEAKKVPYNQVGIQVTPNSISIDTNKTKIFLNTLSKKLEGHIKKISDDLEKGIIDAKEAGIEVNEEHINIDLNKTQNILEDWGKRIQAFVNEFDKVSHNINDNQSK